MDYLITEGYPSAAKKFAHEANLQPRADFDLINERVEIRDSIHKGDLQTAIELINELNPEVSPTSHSYHFLVSMIRLVSCTTHSSKGAEMRAKTPSVLSMIYDSLKDISHTSCHTSQFSDV
jgi:CTLH/CRA C-terminal to LisH motif domain/LisH